MDYVTIPSLRTSAGQRWQNAFWRATADTHISHNFLITAFRKGSPSPIALPFASTMMPIKPTAVQAPAQTVQYFDVRVATPTTEEQQPVVASSLQRALAANNAAPTNNKLLPKWSSPNKWSPNNKSSSGGRRAIFMPSLVTSSGHRPSPRSSFVPLTTTSFDDFTTTNEQRCHQSPPISFLGGINEKFSPSPSIKTTTTVDSIESLSVSLDANASIYSPNGANTARSPAVTPTHIKFLTASIQPPQVWVPPSRDISVCKFIENNNYEYDAIGVRRRSPANTSAPPSSSSNKSRKSHFSPQSEEDEAVRKTRIKTELCLHYINKTSCPFGSSCTYAHGEEELQLTKLMDLHRAGLVDFETYRTKPCLTWISTGSWYVKRASAS